MSRRKWLVRLCAGAALAALLVGLTLAFLRSAWLAGKVRLRVVSELEAATGGRVEVAGFLFDWSEFRVDVNGLVIHGREGPQEPALFQAGRVTLWLKIVSLLRRDIDLAAIHLERPRVHIRIDNAGNSNLPAPRRAAGDRGALDEFLSLAVGEYAIRQGEFSYNSRRTPLDLEGKNLALQMTFSAQGPSYDGMLATDELRIAAPLAVPLALGIRAAVRMDREAVEIRMADLSFARSKLQVRGRIDNLARPAVRLEYSGDLDLDDLTAPLRLPLAPAGRLRTAGTASFGGDAPWSAGGRVESDSLALRRLKTAIGGIRGGLRFRASPEGLHIEQAELEALGGGLNGSINLGKWRELRAQGQLSALPSEALVGALGEAPLPVSALISGPIEIEGALEDGSLRILRATAQMALEEGREGLPVSGAIQAEYVPQQEKLEFGNSHLAFGSSRIHFHGQLERGIRLGVFSTDLQDVISLLNASGVELAGLPLALHRGELRWNGVISGSLQAPELEGRLEAGPVAYAGKPVGQISATLRANASLLDVTSFSLQRSGLRAEGNGRVQLSRWKPVRDGSLAARVNLRDVDLGALAAEFLSGAPLAGRANAAVAIEGTIGEPRAVAALSVGKVAAWEQEFTQLSANANVTTNELRLSGLRARIGEARLRGDCVYRPAGADWTAGDLRFELEGQDLDLQRVPAIQQGRPGLGGMADLRVAGTATRRERISRLTALDGQLVVKDLSLEGRLLGNLQANSRTRGNLLSAMLQAELGKAAVTGSAEWSLTGTSFGQGQIEAKGVTFENLQALGLVGDPDSQLPFDGSFDGEFGFSGPVLNPRNWTAALKVTRVEVYPRNSGKREELTLRNAEPLLAYLDGRGLRLQSAKVEGQGTKLEANGTVGFRGRNQWNLQVLGTVQLPLLSTLEPDLEAAGVARVDAAVRGTLDSPQVYGTLELTDGSLNLRGIPNGLEKVNGLVRFDRNRATVERFTAITGGGSVSLGGFVGLADSGLNYRLRASMEKVRVRYPESVSTTANAQLSLTGTAVDSQLSGAVSIILIGITPKTDLGGLLAQSAGPISVAPVQNRFLRGMRLNVQVETAENAELVTSLTRDIQPEASLSLRGTAARPVVLGRASVSEGEIQFFGNRYRITRGDISLFNPAKIEPVVDLDLETVIRSITVTINLAGPINRMNISYRSDPPLQPGEIVALLTVGRAPGAGAVRQNVSQGSTLQQSGGNTLLGTALSAPLTGRLQRFFGVSRLKIDPDLTSTSNTPQARLTVEQQLTREVTVTYITNLNRTQYQVVRLQWDFSKDFSVIALREENGVFSVDFQYRRRFK